MSSVHTSHHPITKSATHFHLSLIQDQLAKSRKENLHNTPLNICHQPSLPISSLQISGRAPILNTRSLPAANATSKVVIMFRREPSSASSKKASISAILVPSPSIKASLNDRNVFIRNDESFSVLSGPTLPTLFPITSYSESSCNKKEIQCKKQYKFLCIQII